MTNNAKWLRYFRLYVATDNDNKEALDLSDFRVKFRISQQLVGKPCTAEITVYNVAKSTVDRIHIDPNATYDPKNKLQVIIEAGSLTPLFLKGLHKTRSSGLLRSR